MLPGWIKPSLRETWVCLPAFYIKIAGGMTLGFTSSFLTAIKEPDSVIKMDIHTSSWFVSALPISFAISFFLGSFTMARLGRRKAMIICCVPGIVGQFLTFFGKNIPILLAGRVLTGLAVGSNALIVVIVIGEYTSPKNRGSFLNMTTASLNIGSLIVHLIGYNTSWRMLAIVIAIPFILLLITAYISPESPAWLAEKKQYDKSREVFYWLRGRTEESTKEIEELIRAQHHKKVDKTVSEILVDFFLKFKKKNFLYPLSLTVISSIIMESCGRHIFPSYAGQLIKEVVPEGLNPYYSNMIVDLMIILSGFAATYLIRIMRMRTLLFASGAATVVVICLACLSLYLIKNGTISQDYSTVSLVLFGLFFVLGSSGCTCIPIALSGELFPLEHKAVSSFMYNFLAASLMMVYLKIMPYMVSALHIYGAFLVFGGVVAVMLLILYFKLPETTNKTLLEIEDYFDNDKTRHGGIIPDYDDEHEIFGISHK